jgi:drug/metabolite transporter (DMT)-like permease
VPAAPKGPEEEGGNCGFRVRVGDGGGGNCYLDAMFAVLIGLFAALCWALHDLLARRHAVGIGPYCMAVGVMLAGAVLALVPVAGHGWFPNADQRSVVFALLMGVAYAFGVGGLFKAFSLAPVAIVGPLTAGYPALVVAWGLLTGLQPSAAQWLAMALILFGAAVVAQMGHQDDDSTTAMNGKLAGIVLSCAVACLGFAAAVVLGQRAALTLGEFETTFISRFPAAALLLPLAWREAGGDTGRTAPVSGGGWLAILVMALLDVLAVSGINYSGRFPGKEFAAMGISAYGGLAVLLAMAFLKERVSAGQWLGIAVITGGVGILAWPR